MAFMLDSQGRKSQEATDRSRYEQTVAMLQPMREEEEVDDFILRMETNFRHHSVPDRNWKNAVMKLLIHR